MLVDTNIALITLQPQHPQREAVRAAMRANGPLFLTAQNLIEAWAVATRPASANGLGKTPSEAAEALRQLRALFRFLPDTPAIYPEWEALVREHNVSGKSVHDARLVAVMKVHGETSILTFDTGFNRYRDIKVVHPGAVPPSPALEP